MAQAPTEVLLDQVNAALADRNNRIRDRRKRLSKADSRETAESIEAEIATLDADVEILKIQQKALKRGIIPEEFASNEGNPTKQ